MFSFSITIPRFGRGRSRSKPDNTTDDLTPLNSQSHQSLYSTRAKPRLQIDTPKHRPQTICLDAPQSERRMQNRRITIALTSDDNKYEKLLDVDPEIVNVSPRRPSTFYRHQEYIESIPERADVGDKYHEGDFYDGEQTPIATRTLIVEAPRRSRSRARSIAASTHRSASTRSTQSTASTSTVASADTLKSTSTVLSSAPSLTSECSATSQSSQVSSASTFQSSFPDSSARTYYRYLPYEDDNASIKSYERLISGDRCPDEKDRKKLRGILKIAEYAAGRPNRRYSKLR